MNLNPLKMWRRGRVYRIAKCLKEAYRYTTGEMNGFRFKHGQGYGNVRIEYHSEDVADLNGTSCERFNDGEWVEKLYQLYDEHKRKQFGEMKARFAPYEDYFEENES